MSFRVQVSTSLSKDDYIVFVRECRKRKLSKYAMAKFFILKGMYGEDPIILENPVRVQSEVRGVDVTKSQTWAEERLSKIKKQKKGKKKSGKPKTTIRDLIRD